MENCKTESFLRATLKAVLTGSGFMVYEPPAQEIVLVASKDPVVFAIVFRFGHSGGGLTGDLIRCADVGQYAYKCFQREQGVHSPKHKKLPVVIITNQSFLERVQTELSLPEVVVCHVGHTHRESLPGIISRVLAKDTVP